MATMPEGASKEHDGFRGMMSYMDPGDLGDGQSRIQVNAAILRAGELTVRRGLRPLTFDSDDQ